MKSLRLFILIPLLLSACSAPLQTLKTVSNGKTIDTRLVGVWTGSEDDQQQEGVQKSWEMNRGNDGTFQLDFTVIQNKNTEKFTEKGNWWVKKGVFYEYHENSNLTDTYTYEVLDSNRIKFHAKKLKLDMNNDTYEFIDTRKVEQSTSASQNDGLSYEKAILVNSIIEEYKYLKNNCKGCKVIQQALSHKNNIPYDILTVKKTDGSEVSYYFNIKSFFGKF